MGCSEQLLLEVRQSAETFRPTAISWGCPTKWKSFVTLVLLLRVIALRFWKLPDIQVNRDLPMKLFTAIGTSALNFV